MAPGDPERPDRPEYNVYRAGSGRRGRRSEPKRPERSSGSGDGASEKPSEGRGYTVYKSRRGFKRSGEGVPLRERLPGRGGSKPRGPGETPTWRRVVKWAAIAAAVWLLISFVAFAISAQIQKSKLNDAAAAELGGFPLLLLDGQNILVIGTDARPEGSNEGGAETKPKCLEAAAHGDPPPSSCLPSRADTLMVVHAGGGSFSKISIPRDTLASIPGEGDQRINAAYAFGGAALQIKTVEDFLGIDINHVVILDFAGFADFIDSIGGVTVSLPAPVKSKISGGSSNGGITLKLERGENHLDGQQALALARTRENLKDPSEDDTDRARRQQLILQGIKNQITSPWRAPINFLRGPWIGWNAPKAMVSDMGAFVLPQVGLSAAIGGDSGTKILVPSGVGSDGALIVAQKQCRTAVKKLLGEPGPHPPKCSPGGDAVAP
ncbi:MAG: LCP family protein [Solirubrobacterales bacterium]|nr:LCP family protein [Solirubrobacterales bacterium]